MLRRAVCSLVLLLLALGPGPALAEATDAGSADEAEVRFRLGNQAFLARDYESALAHYLASNRLAPNRNVLFNVARCYERLDRYVEAYRYYEIYRASGELSETASKALSKAMTRIRPRVALIDVRSTPPGATIYIDRKDLGAYGKTPRRLAVPPGEHTVILERPGYVPFEGEPTKVELGGESNVVATLGRLTGTLVVEGEPALARITVLDPSGDVTAKLPAKLQVTAGTHTMVVAKDGYHAEQRSVTVPVGETVTTTVILRQQTGALVVDSDENGALILLDGEAVGFAPTVIDDIPVGEHDLEVELEGFRPFRKTVVIADGKRTSVTAELPIAEDVAAASRATESLIKAPASVSLITRPELSSFGYTSVADALEGLRGVYTSDDLTYHYPGFRGFSPFGEYGNRVQMQIDGHVLNDDWLGSSYIEHDLLVGLHALERLEVIRGPGSALYGSGAFYGVINLVTPDHVRRTRVRAGASMLSKGAVRGYGDFGIRLGQEGGLWVYGGALYAQPQDFVSPARVDPGTGQGGVAKDVGEVIAGSVLGRAFWRDLTLQWYFHQRDKGIPTASYDTLFGDPRAASNDGRAFVELRYEPRLSDAARLHTRLYYDWYEYRGFFPYATEQDPADPALILGGPAREGYEGHWLGAELRSVLTPKPWARLTFGGDYSYHFAKILEGSDDEGSYVDETHPFHAFSAYAVGDLEFIEELALSIGLRFDGWSIGDLPTTGDADGPREDRFFWTLNPRLALRVHPTRAGTLKLLAGRAFRAPSVYEMTYQDGGITQKGAGALDPETIYSAELEYTHELVAGLRLLGSLFMNHVSNLIELREDPSDELLVFRNVEDPVWTLGAEVELRKSFAKGSMLALQYSYQHTRLEEPFGDRELTNSPAHLAGVKVIVPVFGRELRVASRVAVQSARLDRAGGTTNPAVLWDITLSGEVGALGMRYNAGVRNLLGWRYSHPVGDDLLDVTLRQPGLSLMMDVSFGI